MTGGDIKILNPCFVLGVRFVDWLPFCRMFEALLDLKTHQLYSDSLKKSLS